MKVKVLQGFVKLLFYALPTGNLLHYTSGRKDVLHVSVQSNEFFTVKDLASLPRLRQDFDARLPVHIWNQHGHTYRAGKRSILTILRKRDCTWKETRHFCYRCSHFYNTGNKVKATIYSLRSPSCSLGSIETSFDGRYQRVGNLVKFTIAGFQRHAIQNRSK